MSDPFWDRVTARHLRKLPDQPLLGRYRLGSAGLANGQPAAAYAAVVPGTSTRWSAEVAGVSASGRFAHDGQPDPALAGRAAAIAAALAEAVLRTDDPENTTEYERWIAVPPLAGDVLAQLRGVAPDDPVPLFEREFDAAFPQLAAVCQQPVARLRREVELTALSRARRFAPGAADYLAGHTEDWQQRTMGGVHPRRVQSLRNDEDLDLYENRATLRLLAHLAAFFEWRRRRLEAAVDVLDDLDRFAAQLGTGRWRTSHRMSQLLAEFHDHADLLAGIDDLLEQTRQRQARLLGLHASRLCRNRQVSRSAVIGTGLRPTNLFLFHEDYRRIHGLWKAWALVDASTGLDSAVSPMAFCDAYDQFVALITARALESLDFRALTTLQPLPGGPKVAYTNRADDQLTLSVRADGTLELCRDQRILLTVVPVPHQLAAPVTSRQLDALLDDLRTPAPAGHHRVLIYPSTRVERQSLPRQVRARLESPGHDLAEGTGVGLIPAAPTELDSVERVARALQWARTAPDATAYPPVVSAQATLIDVAADTDWTSRNAADTLAVLRHPSQAQWQHLQEQVSSWRDQRLPDAKRRERQVVAERFNSQLDAALAIVRRLATCPVCGEPVGSSRDFQPREGTFTAECRQCHTRWGTQSCGNCARTYPVIFRRQNTGTQPLGTADVLGIDVLATNCHASATHATVCPHCGTCGLSDTRPSCWRCHPTALPTGDSHGR
ncbi:hypothetical protein Cme02nite_55790 [Catellatospora methionotrophica]|uniref:DUF2357 domain-containing protein n=1 Tax=Catellatospora methionotrophica TaxID=121620 RepID=A0A8J3LAA6_9ACTN|nr:hypothetical protein [Catellatospora methionotrophica]GIG17247.1 hypothetical protein Cme02nite_55790 [Catellatospora methionotrophica]